MQNKKRIILDANILISSSQADLKDLNTSYDIRVPIFLLLESVNKGFTCAIHKILAVGIPILKSADSISPHTDLVKKELIEGEEIKFYQNFLGITANQETGFDIWDQVRSHDEQLQRWAGIYIDEKGKEVPLDRFENPEDKKLFKDYRELKLKFHDGLNTLKNADGLSKWSTNDIKDALFDSHLERENPPKILGIIQGFLKRFGISPDTMHTNKREQFRLGKSCIETAPYFSYVFAVHSLFMRNHLLSNQRVKNRDLTSDFLDFFYLMLLPFTDYLVTKDEMLRE